MHFQAAMIGVVTLLVLVAWRPLAPRALRVVPAPLVAVVVATLAAVAIGLGVNRVDIPERLTDALVLPTFADLGGLGWSVLGAGAALAFVASAETLLCATAVDKMHSGPRARFDRELAAQGVGNLLCGALGALPMTGVIVRSSANVESGGSTRLSAVLHGLWLLLFCAALPFVLRQIPTAVLAAVLVFTGYKLVNVAAIRELARFGRAEVFIYVSTLVGIVCVDLLTGVVLGIGLSLARLLYQVSHLEIEIREGPEPERLDFVLRGAATVMRLPKLAAALERLPGGVALHVHLEELSYIDHACMDLLVNWEKQNESLGGTLTIDWPGLEARFRNAGPRMAAIPEPDGARAA
jgi:MFS superfamily sulfate permease-like transporter